MSTRQRSASAAQEARAPTMPEMSTQVYWHECPEPVAPWVNQEELRRTVQRSRQLRKLRISPNDFFVELSTSERKMLRQRKVRAEKADRGLLMEPGLTTFGAINALLHHLGKELVTREEATQVVDIIAAEYRAVEAQTQATFAESQHAASQLTYGSQSQLPETQAAATAQDVKEGPLLQAVRLLLEPRGLKMEVLTKRELQQKHCRISPADLIAGRRVAMLFDKQRAAMVGALLDAKVSSRTVRQSMHLLVPVAEPCPWRRRVFGVSAIDAFHCIATFVYHAELDAHAHEGATDDEDDEVPAPVVEAPVRTEPPRRRKRGDSSGSSSASDSSSSRKRRHSRRRRERDARIGLGIPAPLFPQRGLEGCCRCIPTCSHRAPLQPQLSTMQRIGVAASSERPGLYQRLRVRKRRLGKRPQTSLATVPASSLPAAPLQQQVKTARLLWSLLDQRAPSGRQGRMLQCCPTLFNVTSL